MSGSAGAAWLGAGEPAAVEVVNAGGACRILLTCDHASNRLPARLGDLGLSDSDRVRHIAWDGGIAEVARLLASRLDAPLILSGYSRLVIDCNRPLAASDSIPRISETTPIPGNHSVSAAEAAARAATFFWPYHDALDVLLRARIRRVGVPLYVALHSFTPVYKGLARPWHVGVTYRYDRRLAALLLAALRREAALCVGENQPYPVELKSDYSVPVHGERRGLPCALIEVRQDLLAEPAGVVAWAERLAVAVRAVADHPSLAVRAVPAPDVFEPRYEEES
ncbi:MAG: N-formylglutamate amidohydrolase [Alphaproteobacteria bacterium]|nr:N-formylglutamate amidohydrolase [Alphaproteobacteria bacterium]